jgi:type IV pilus assembly protein PilE
MHNKHSGVTLVELMIVVAVVAILAAIAYPSYRNQIMRSHRAEAKAALLQIQVEQEKWFLQNNVYTNSLANLKSASPTTKGYYTLGVVVGNPATTYTATATKAGGQSDDTHCATFTITETGSRGATNTDCW